MTQRASITEKARPAQGGPAIRAFHSTPKLISVLFVTALIGILFFDFVYVRLTETKGFDKDAWEGWSSFMPTILGLGISFAGLVATVWIAFRVESIARRQLANDDRDQDMALLRFDVIEPAKASTGPFFEALSRNRKATYLIQQIETDLDNWHYRKIDELYPRANDGELGNLITLDLNCRECGQLVSEEKAERAIETEALTRKNAQTLPYKQVLRRSFIDMYSVLDNLTRGSDVDPLNHIPAAQREELVDHVQAYVDHMYFRDDLPQNTENFVNALKRKIISKCERSTNRPTPEQAPLLFFEICAHHEGQVLERNTPKNGEEDPLVDYDRSFWRTKFLNSQTLPENFEVGFSISESAVVQGNMAQVLEMSLLSGVHSVEAFDARFDRYVSSKDGVLKPDNKTRLLCWSEYRSALTRDVDDLTKSIILDAIHRGAADVPKLNLQLFGLSTDYIASDEGEQEDQNAISVALLTKKSSKICRCSHALLALGD